MPVHLCIGFAAQSMRPHGFTSSKKDDIRCASAIVRRLSFSRALQIPGFDTVTTKVSNAYKLEFCLNFCRLQWPGRSFCRRLRTAEEARTCEA